MKQDAIHLYLTTPQPANRRDKLPYWFAQSARSGLEIAHDLNLMDFVEANFNSPEELHDIVLSKHKSGMHYFSINVTEVTESEMSHYEDILNQITKTGALMTVICGEMDLLKLRQTDKVYREPVDRHYKTRILEHA